jgi:hypothetical protein
MDAYIYNALEIDEIRLLELRYGDINTQLDANLHIYRLPDDEEPRSGHQVFLTRDSGFNVPNAPSYQALSYTWGVDAPTQPVLKYSRTETFPTSQSSQISTVPFGSFEN